MKKLNLKIIGSVAVLFSQLGAVQLSVAESADQKQEIDAVNVVDEVFSAAIKNRAAMTSEIVDQLREEAESKGLEDDWESDLTSVLGNASNKAFMAAYNASSAGADYKTIAAATVGINYDKAALVKDYNTGGTTLLGKAKFGAVAKLGSSNKDFVYTPFPPCRVVDTRTAGGKINGGAWRSFYAKGSGALLAPQGGHAGGCLVNGGSDVFGGYVLNITVTQPEGNGHLRVYANGDPLPPASILNYTTGQTIANSVVVKGGYANGREFKIYTSSRAHVIVDVMGYFDKPERTAPSRTTVNASRVINVGARSAWSTPACPSNYTMVGGGFDSSHYDVSAADSFISSNKWRCAIQNDSGANATVNCFGYCISIPGK